MHTKEVAYFPRDVAAIKPKMLVVNINNVNVVKMVWAGPYKETILKLYKIIQSL